MEEPMTATKIVKQRDLVRQRHAEMADNRAALPTPPWYAGPNPHFQPTGGPFWFAGDWVNDSLRERLAAAKPGELVRFSDEDFHPHSKLPAWMKPILDMLLTGKGLTRL